MDKKISLLAVLSLLTACGGGSGSGIPETTLPGETISAEQIEKLKGMKYETSDSDTEVSVADDGKINVVINHSNGESEHVTFSTPKEENGNGLYKSVFNGKYEGPMDDNDSNSEVVTANYDQILTLGGEKAGLSYTQFGSVVQHVKDINGDTSRAFAEGNVVVYGGIEDKKFDRSSLPTEDVTFNGGALGYAEADGILLELDGTAKLVANQNSENLTLTFDNFYTVNAQSNNMGMTAVTFSDENKVTNEDFADFSSHISGYNLDAKYYGTDAQNISEVSGALEGYSNDAYKLEVSFGAKKVTE